MGHFNPMRLRTCRGARASNVHPMERERNMYRYDGYDSASTFASGRNGMVLGAVAGAVLFSLGSLAMDLMNVGAGGPGLAVMAGITFGGLAGTIVGLLRSRRGGRRNYGGGERRVSRAPYAGMERRSPWKLRHG
jgi:hypothetical protein